MVVAACALVMFGTWNAHNGFGVFLPVLAKEFGWSRGAISVAASFQLMVGGVLAFALGAASDRYGPRAILALSALLSGAAFLGSSLISALWQFYLLQGLLLGVGMASIYLVPIVTVSRWFVEQRGLALGVLLGCHNLSFITGPPLSAWLINTFNWRVSYLLLGGLVWCVALPASLFTRFPDGSPTSRAERHNASRPGPAREGPTFRQALADRRVWLLGGTWLLLGFAWMIVAIHLVSYAKDRGVTLEAASLTLTLFWVGATVGRVAFGAAADRLGTLRTSWLSQTLQLITLGWLLTGPSLAAVYILMLGFGSGAAGSDTMVVKGAAEVFGVRTIGARMGVMNLGWRIGAAMGPAAAGFIYDATASYSLAFGLGLAGLAMSFALFTLGMGALPPRAGAPQVPRPA